MKFIGREEQLKKLDYEKYETTINKARKHSLDYINDKTAVDKIYHAIDERPYKFLSKEFVKALDNPISATKPYDDLETVNKLVCMDKDCGFVTDKPN